MSLGFLYWLVSAGYVESRGIYTHYPELASWYIYLIRLYLDSRPPLFF